MRKSRKILDKADIPYNLNENDRMTIENNVLLKHVIDNDLKHIWGAIKLIAGAIVGLAAAAIKSLFFE